MYEQQFGLRNLPFEPSVHADRTFRSEVIEEIGLRLEHLVVERQLQLSRMSQSGDSGSIIREHDSDRIVGLLFAGGMSNSFGNKIQRVLEPILEGGSADRRVDFRPDASPQHG